MNFSIIVLLCISCTICCVSVVSCSNFCKMRTFASCSEEDLSRLKPNERLIVRATIKPCGSEPSEVRCTIRMQHNNSTVLEPKHHLKGFLLLYFNVIREMDGATLQCDQRCSDGTVNETANTTLTLVRPENITSPSRFNINVSITKHWAIGKTSVFAFSSEGSMPKPVHTCWLLRADGRVEETLSEKSNESRSRNGHFDLRTEFTVLIKRSHEGGKIKCRAELASYSIYSENMTDLPRLLKPCTTRLRLPVYNWINNKTVNVTVDSSNDNWVATSHTCYLESERNRNTTLRVFSHSSAVSLASVTVRRHWGSAASILCQANQSGIFETWARQSLPAALYKASPPAIIGLTPSVYEGVNATFSVISGDGNPTVHHSCTTDRGSVVTAVSRKSDPHGVTTLLRFKADKRDSRVQCSAVQVLDSRTVFSSNFSQGVSVYYRSNNSQIVSPSGFIIARSTVNVTLVSYGGRPAVRDLSCWVGASRLSLADGKYPSIVSKTARIERNFWFRASREHNEMILSCRFKQDKNLIEWRNQSLIVYHPVSSASVRMTSELIVSGLAVQVELLASELGHPPAQHTCSVGGRNLRAAQLPSELNPSSIWTFSALPTDNGMRISCRVVQTAPSGAIVFNMSVFSDSLNVLYGSDNSWNATQPLLMREDEPLCVSLRSVGGNPEPRHQCWLKAAEKDEINMTKLNETRQGEIGSVHSQLVTNFSIVTSRYMNGGSVMCRVSQGNRNESTRVHEQSVTVFFRSKTIAWSGQLLYGTDLLVTALTEEGNPRPELHCKLQSGNSSLGGNATSVPQPDVTRGSNGGWIRKVRIFHRFAEERAEVTVACLISQSSAGFANLQFPSTESSLTLKPTFPSPSAAQLAAALGCLLTTVVAISAVAAAAVLSRKRDVSEENAATVGGKADEPNAKYRYEEA